MTPQLSRKTVRHWPWRGTVTDRVLVTGGAGLPSVPDAGRKIIERNDAIAPLQ